MGMHEKNTNNRVDYASREILELAEIDYILSDTSDNELDDAGISREVYEKFLESFYEIPHEFQKLLKDKYAKKPETFQEEKFDIRPMISSGIKLALPYMETINPPMNDWIEHWVNIDAPFSYAMRFEDEQISVVSFRLDFKRKLLIVDQLQGGTTSDLQKQSRVAGRARNRIGIDGLGPEGVMYDMAEELARRIGMRGIALRKWGYSLWRDDKKELGNTIYDRVARLKGHKILDGTAYTFERTAD